MGRLYARRLASDGYRVAILDLNEAGLQETAQASSAISTFVCDISSESAVSTTFEQIANAMGAVDYLVHCAALMPATAVVNESPASVERLSKINYIGTINIIEAGVKPMVARNSGTAVIFGSVAGDAIVPKITAVPLFLATIGLTPASIILMVPI